MKLLIVGQNPSAAKPRKNSTLDRLQKWCDELEVDEYDFVNCIDSAGNYKELEINRENLLKVSIGREKVIALGNFSSMTLSKLGIKHFKMPHPSPRNRKLNDKEYEKNMLKECKNYLQNS
jgi:hypothetical protein